jgi:hypothetical protein
MQRARWPARKGHPAAGAIPASRHSVAAERGLGPIGQRRDYPVAGQLASRATYNRFGGWAWGARRCGRPLQSGSPV